ncbi:MAG: adenosine monophosphate-protein transferase [Candidatus Altiarchaeales archaeon IMC4]|nr:MAG: adenosine monophosphate-protein transferase [Candidatus Altiarchaeales archaeon IMC4]
METEVIRIEKPMNLNMILGQSHFIKTVEDLYEALVCCVPGIKFGLAFCEASGPCLVRIAGNDRGLEKLAAKNAMKIGAGHIFIIFLKDAFPINVLNAVKNASEVCSIFCATANDVEVVVAETALGRGILGVVDGQRPRGAETEKDVAERKEFLRKIGYKL